MLVPPPRADFGLRIFNPDGSEAEKSGNGLRIFAKCLRDHGLAKRDAFTIETPGGVVECLCHVATAACGSSPWRWDGHLPRARDPDERARPRRGRRAAAASDGTALAVTAVSVGQSALHHLRRPARRGDASDWAR